MALAVEGAVGVNAALLAASVHHCTLVHISTRFSIFLQFLASWTFAVVAADGITALIVAATVLCGALVYIILAARTLKSCRTLAHLRSCFRTLPSIEAGASSAQQVQTARFIVVLDPSRTALIDSLMLHSVHLLVHCVVTRPSLIAHAPPPPCATLFPHLDHPTEGLNAWLLVSY